MNIREVWKGKKFSVYQEDVEIAPGRVIPFEFASRIDGTRSIVEDEQGRIMITKEFRHELSAYDWRIPGGKLNFENEDIKVAAQRELKEETGVVAKDWTYLWHTNPDSSVRFKRHFLLAKNLTQGRQDLELGEDIEAHWMAKDDVIEIALSGKMAEEFSALSILRYLLND